MTPLRPCPGADLGVCPLCGRPMIVGPSVHRHHWVPKLKGGRDWAWLHRVCHKKIHAELREVALARAFATPEALRAHPAIRDFIDWVQRQPPAWTGRHAGRRR